MNHNCYFLIYLNYYLINNLFYHLYYNLFYKSIDNFIDIINHDNQLPFLIPLKLHTLPMYLVYNIRLIFDIYV